MDEFGSFDFFDGYIDEIATGFAIFSNHENSYSPQQRKRFYPFKSTSNLSPFKRKKYIMRNLYDKTSFKT